METDSWFCVYGIEKTGIKLGSNILEVETVRHQQQAQSTHAHQFMPRLSFLNLESTEVNFQIIIIKKDLDIY